jgi:hypothetical protein
LGILGRMSLGRTMRLWPIAALCAATMALGGCSSQIVDMPSLAAPADAPERPKEAGSYLPVHDLPPDRTVEAMKPAEVAKIQAELMAARDRQAVAGSPGAPAKPAKK